MDRAHPDTVNGRLPLTLLAALDPNGKQRYTVTDPQQIRNTAVDGTTQMYIHRERRRQGMTQLL